MSFDRFYLSVALDTMPNLKTMYTVISLGIFVYFLLYGVIMRKLLVVQISFRDIPNNARTVQAEGSPTDGNIKYSFRDTKADDHLEFEVEPSDFKVIQDELDSIAKSLPEKQILSTERLRTTAGRNPEQRKQPERVDASKLLVSFLRGFGSLPMEDDAVRAQTAVTTQVPRDEPENPSLRWLVMKLDSYLREQGLSKDEQCPSFPTVGKVRVERRNVTLEALESELSFVEKGGQWKPSQCKAKRKVAIVIPFRDRQGHLNIFLRHMHAFLKLQLLDYRIFVVEQAGQEKFNRGVLMNIGFTEALKMHNFTCVIFHDVDLLPEDTRNDYSCPSSPRHMSTAVDTMDYKLQYKSLFGGAEGFWKEHFVRVNGFPNRYWGWGGEDDDLYERIIERNLHLTRPAQMIGSYTMLTHGHKDLDSNPERYNQLRLASSFIDSDGLNSLHYDLLSNEELPLYTLLTVHPLKS